MKLFHFALISFQFNSSEQEELKSIEGLHPASRSCKEYVESIFSTCAFISTCSVLLKSCEVNLSMSFKVNSVLNDVDNFAG